MTPELAKALEEIIEVQNARILNWSTVDGPSDDHLETIHLAHIAELRKEIETLTK